MSQKNQTTYIEPGYTAFDDDNNDITDQVVIGGDTVDNETVGKYYITYSVTDTKTNLSVTVTRFVYSCNCC